MTIPGSDAAKVTVFVAVTQADAFEIFTHEIDAWWRTGPKYRIGGKGRGRLFFEEKLGGRLFETFETASGDKTFEAGTVTVWEPPARLSFEWRAVNFKPGEKTLVEVGFEPSGDGTLVTVKHSGFAALRDDHPVRHGLLGPAFTRQMGMWWSGLMTSLREYAPGAVTARGRGEDRPR